VDHVPSPDRAASRKVEKFYSGVVYAGKKREFETVTQVAVADGVTERCRYDIISSPVAHVIDRGGVLRYCSITRDLLNTLDPPSLIQMMRMMHADLDRAPDRVCAVGGLELIGHVLGRYQSDELSIEHVLNAAHILRKACELLEGRVHRGNDNLAKLTAESKEKVGALEEVFEVLRTSTNKEDVKEYFLLIVKQLTMVSWWGGAGVGVGVGVQHAATDVI
jgi:hypothetical protein